MGNIFKSYFQIHLIGFLVLVEDFVIGFFEAALDKPFLWCKRTKLRKIRYNGQKCCFLGVHSF